MILKSGLEVTQSLKLVPIERWVRFPIRLPFS